jgi:spermidine/putrescine transport system substrate-binding protein
MKIKHAFYLTLLSLGSVSLSSAPNPQVIKAKVLTPTPSGSGLTLRIFNWEDYIALGDEEDPESFDTMAAFQEYYLETYGEEVNFVYDTYSTNEEMYNTVKLNGAKYDLIAPSDYMIQRMIREEMLTTFDTDEEGRYEHIPNYNDYASPYHQELFSESGWTEYAVGYMWGTFGLLYNTTINETVSEDMKSWSILWDSAYNKKISIKDSMREGYLVGLFKYHHDALIALADDHEEGLLTDKEYHDVLNDLLNDTSPETIKGVDKALRELKQNIYGLEVDQGKNDMIKGTIAVNTAWSGDAVYAIYQAAEEVGEDVLRYAVPEEGSNTWFDGWVMPKGANTALAQEFINFVSDPAVATENMDYIGYTSFIAGEDVLAYINDYDEVIDPSEDGYEMDLRYFFGDTIENEDDAIIKISNDYIGGQLATQFPTYDEIIRSAVMRDFGDQNKRVIDMWANFKATEIQNWMIVFSIVIVLAVGALGTYQFVTKHKAARRKRLMSQK